MVTQFTLFFFLFRDKISRFVKKKKLALIKKLGCPSVAIVYNVTYEKDFLKLAAGWVIATCILLIKWPDYARNLAAMSSQKYLYQISVQLGFWKSAWWLPPMFSHWAVADQ